MSSFISEKFNVDLIEQKKFKKNIFMNMEQHYQDYEEKEC